ncbi:MAG TPA: endolytic transglycosylase MltG, partial [Anaeromyxobacteraceae bacterium]
MKLLRVLLGAALVALVTASAAGLAIYRQLASYRETPFGTADEKVIEIPSGATPHQVVRLLARGGALADERLAWRYLRWWKRDPRALRAGEYTFEGALLPDEVLEKVYRGEVKTYQFTIPEGLRMDEIAALIEQSGLGRASELMPLMHDPAFARALGVPFANLEGYLFPDTYTFTK